MIIGREMFYPISGTNSSARVNREARQAAADEGERREDVVPLGCISMFESVS